MQHKLLRTQTFWIFVTLCILLGVMSVVSENFGSYNNLYNISRNAAFIALIALGQSLVIITGGIDLSVGSVMGLVGIVTGVVMQGGGSLAEAGVVACLVAVICGAINGCLISYGKLSPFVVTLGTMSIARSLALVASNNKTLFEFGPDQELFFGICGGSYFGIATPVLALLMVAALASFYLRCSKWGSHLYAVGGNEQAARVTGVRVDLVKTSAYIFSSLGAGIAAVLMVGWQGAVTNALGTGYELNVIAAAVLGGASLSGGAGGVIGAVIGSALIETLRNSLLLLGVDPYWQGTFVGVFIVLAVIISTLRERKGA